MTSDGKKRPSALKLAPSRSDSSSSENSFKPVRTPRFAEHTSVVSPVHGASSFTDPEKGGISNTGFARMAAPMSPLKSAMRVPGSAVNPMSPTFRLEANLEKREKETEEEQARDVKIKARVRLAKFALRGVSFSCSLIILAMMSSAFAIFNTTRALPSQNGMPAWANNTKTWPQKLVLAMACASLVACIAVFIAYCRGGHRRAEKVSTYYTMFALGWFILSMVLWAIAAGLFQHSRASSSNKDLWGWSCVENKRSEVFSDKVDYALVCRLQNWALICIIIEVVIEVICVGLYSIVFYRYYTKRRLWKSMNSRDRARSDLYLAQLRTQSAPNTPGFPKSPAFSQYALSPRFPPTAYRSMDDIKEEHMKDEVENPFTTPMTPSFKTQSAFKLQPPPKKGTSAGAQAKFTSTPAPVPPAPAQPAELAPSQTAARAEVVHQHGPTAAEEPTYEAVPIPGAYSTSQ